MSPFRPHMRSSAVSVIRKCRIDTGTLALVVRQSASMRKALSVQRSFCPQTHVATPSRRRVLLVDVVAVLVVVVVVVVEIAVVVVVVVVVVYYNLQYE